MASLLEKKKRPYDPMQQQFSILWLFDTYKNQVTRMGKGLSYGEEFSYFQYKYLFHSKKRPYYIPNQGLFSMKWTEEVCLLNEYQFRLLLSHTKQRNKVLKAGGIVNERDVLKTYSTITQEKLEELNALSK